MIVSTEFNDRRYIVGWENIVEGRVNVFVFDRLSHKLVYVVNCKEERRKLMYPYIQEHYGATNCVPPRQLAMSQFM